MRELSEWERGWMHEFFLVNSLWVTLQLKWIQIPFCSKRRIQVGRRHHTDNTGNLLLCSVIVCFSATRQSSTFGRRWTWRSYWTTCKLVLFLPLSLSLCLQQKICCLELQVEKLLRCEWKCCYATVRWVKNFPCCHVAREKSRFLCSKSKIYCVAKLQVKKLPVASVCDTFA